MKLIKVFLSSFLLSIVFFSCSTESFESDLSEDVEIRTSNPSECGFIDELCNPCEYRAYQEPLLVAFCCDSLVSSGGSSSSLKVTPIIGLNNSIEFLIKSENGDFILSNTTNNYVLNKLQKKSYPKYLNNLFSLDQNKLSNNSYTKSELQTDLNVTVSSDENNNLFVDPSDFTIINDDIQALAADPCRFQGMEVMEDYYEELNSPLEVYSEALLEIWMDNVDPIFNKCSKGLDLDVQCLDSRCVVDGLVNDPSIAPDRKRNLQINYLALLFDFDQIEVDALVNSTNEAIEEIFYLSRCGTLNLCPFSDDSNDKLESIIKSLILNSNFNLEAIKEELEKVDHIIIDHETIDSCEKILKVLDLLVGEDTNNPICNIMNDLGNSTNVKWTIEIDEDKNIVEDRLGRTTNIRINRTITSHLNPDLCDSSCVQIASVIVHEAIHAEFIRLIFDSVDPTNPLSFRLYSVLWNKIADEKFGGHPNQHHAMGVYYAEKYSAAIWRMLGMQGDSLDYLFWAYDGLNLDTAWVKGDTIITPSEWDSIQTNYMQSIHPNLNFDCD